MAWYPGATKMELQPESDDQQAIRPTQVIVHSIAGPWTPRRLYEYWRDSTSLESHFGLGYDGELAQYIGTETRADANAAANRRGDGTGAISIETASNTSSTDPWTAEQVDALIRLGAWAHERHGIPLRICRTASDGGFGWHNRFSAWSAGGTACPGNARIRQFKEVVFPGIVARATGQSQEGDMPLTKDDAEKVWNADIIPSPTKAKDNPTWQPASYLRTTHNEVKKVQAQIGALTGLVKELVAKGGSLTAAQAEAAAAAGARAALAELGDVLTPED